MLVSPPCFVFPPFLGAIRSSSFSMRKRFFGGSGGSVDRGGSDGLRSVFGSMIRLLKKSGWELSPASARQRQRSGTTRASPGATLVTSVSYACSLAPLGLAPSTSSVDRTATRGGV